MQRREVAGGYGRYCRHAAITIEGRWIAVRPAGFQSRRLECPRGRRRVCEPRFHHALPREEGESRSKLARHHLFAFERVTP